MASAIPLASRRSASESVKCSISEAGPPSKSLPPSGEQLDNAPVAGGEGEGEGFEALAEGTVTDNKQARFRLFSAHPREGREQTVDALRVYELSDVEDHRGVAGD